MQHQQQISVRRAALAALSVSLTLGACSMTQVSDWVPRKPSLTSFDWNLYSRASNTIAPMGEEKATPADYVTADGSCASGGAPEAASAEQPTAAIALLMTECQVVNTLGPPLKIDIGANERGDREVVMLYTQGEQPGRYRFTAGRLTLIERIEQPAPPPKQKKPAAKPRSSVS